MLSVILQNDVVKIQKFFQNVHFKCRLVYENIEEKTENVHYENIEEKAEKFSLRAFSAFDTMFSKVICCRTHKCIFRR